MFPLLRDPFLNYPCYATTISEMLESINHISFPNPPPFVPSVSVSMENMFYKYYIQNKEECTMQQTH